MVAAIDYGLESIRASERNPPLLPPAILIQARVAARNGIGLDTVLRRYFAGYALLGDFLIEEAEAQGLLGGAELKRLLRTQASIFDRLLAEVSEEHAREAGARTDTSEERRTELVERLLGGERLDASALAYDLQGVHVGMVAKGPGTAEAIRRLAERLDRRLLLIRQGEDVVWVWLGGRRPPDPENLRRLLPEVLPPGTHLAFGEPGEGVAGWRLTHRQACAALPIARQGLEPFARYSDAAMLASILKDDLLTTSLREIYLKPLEEERDGGEVARETLRAYFASGRNVSSAAAAFGINRHTVTIRLRAIEERIGHPLDVRSAEIDTALQLEELGILCTRQPGRFHQLN